MGAAWLRGKWNSTLVLDRWPAGAKDKMLRSLVKRGEVTAEAETSNLMFIDFAQPPFDPAKIEWIK